MQQHWKMVCASTGNTLLSTCKKRVIAMHCNECWCVSVRGTALCRRLEPSFDRLVVPSPLPVLHAVAPAQVQHALSPPKLLVLVASPQQNQDEACSQLRMTRLVLRLFLASHGTVCQSDLENQLSVSSDIFAQTFVITWKHVCRKQRLCCVCGFVVCHLSPQ